MLLDFMVLAIKDLHGFLSGPNLRTNFRDESGRLVYTMLFAIGQPEVGTTELNSSHEPSAGSIRFVVCIAFDAPTKLGNQNLLGELIFPFHDVVCPHRQ